MAARKGNSGYNDRRKLSAFDRFVSYCKFEPDTGCVVWTGGQTKGRGHHVPYGSFWFEGARWFAHRWAAKHIHGLDIETLQVDHCCPGMARPNTLCVQHLQAITLRENRALQDIRKKFIYLQVGLVEYDEVYGPPAQPEPLIPFHEPPEWLPKRGPTHDPDTCPF